MKRILCLALCAVLAVCLSGCVSVDLSLLQGVYGSGDLKSYTFTVGEITEIRADFACNILYYAAPSDTVTLEIQPNLVEFVTVEESSGVLTVRSKRNIRWQSPGKTPVLTVSTPALNRVTLTGIGAFDTRDPIAADSFVLRMDGAGSGDAEFDVNRLSVELSGLGSLNLSGRADTADFDLSGAGYLNAISLQTRLATVSLSGVGTIRVSCSETLRIDADGAGTVEYRGTPSVIVHNNGLVSVNQVD